MRKQNHCCM